MPDDAPKWTVTAWHCSCHVVEWRRYSHGTSGTAPFGVVGGLFSYRTVDEFLADGHADLTPVDVDNVAALLADHRDLGAEHAKTVSNFEDFAEEAAGRRADLGHELDTLRRELKRAQVVVDAARAWRTERYASEAIERLATAVDATEAPVPP